MTSGELPAGRRTVEALALTRKRKNWIPASAGMTSGELPAGRRTVEALALAGERRNWIPAFAGLRRQDAEANIRAANGPQGELRMQRVMTSKEVRAGRRTVEALASTVELWLRRLCPIQRSFGVYHFVNGGVGHA